MKLQVEKNVRLNASKGEAAWQGIGTKIGIEIWRIEKFKVVAWPKEQYGSFFSGDSYIVLRTYKKTPDDEKLSFDVHFWLGKETSQDEAGTAAYKTVELDDFLGGAPVQYREVQGHESESFLKLFPTFKTMEGGVESGFKKVKPEEYRPRLLQVKGTGKRVIVREVPLTFESLNAGDVFILDAGMNIYQWNGKESSGFERNKGAEFARALDDERKGLPKVHVFNQDDGKDEEFWTALGDKGTVKPASAGGDDKDAASGFTKKLFRLSDATGSIVFKEEASGKITKNQLHSDDVFVFDSGSEVFVWVGKSATANEKRMGLQYAQDYLVKYNRPAHLPISRVLEGGENEVFNASFDNGDAPKFGSSKATKDAAPVPGVQK
eukprot:Partr_v1_DN28494_c1_g1_i2_m41271 putative gelsolin